MEIKHEASAKKSEVDLDFLIQLEKKKTKT